MRRRRTSRLTRVQAKKNKRQAMFFICLAGLLFLLFIFLGIPSLIKMVVFLGDLRSSSEVSETEKEIILRAPQLLALPEATSSAYINIKGYGEPGTTIKILRSEIEKDKTIVDKSGSFSINKFQLEEGENEIKAVAEDPDGKQESKTSKTYIVIFDQSPPKLEITGPQDGQEFFDKEKEIAVGGQAGSDVRVTVNGFLASVNSDGVFTKIITLSEGENEIKVEAVDLAGNKTEKKIKVKYRP